MNRLSPEVERLLWEVAESDDPRAFDEFEVRFPHLTGELGRRIAMVRELRGARGHSAIDLPKFEMRNVPAAPAVATRRSIFIGGSMILAALAFGSYLVTSQFVSGPAPIQPITPVAVNTPPLPDPPITTKPPAQLPITQIQVPENNNPPNNPAPAVEKAPPKNDPLYLKVQDVKLERAHLLTALQLVAASGGLTLEIAPGMSDPEVRIEYHNLSALEILSDLGRQYGFTAFDQGPGKVLIVPAVDNRTPKRPLQTSDLGTAGPAKDQSPPKRDANPASGLPKKVVAPIDPKIIQKAPLQHGKLAR